MKYSGPWSNLATFELTCFLDKIEIRYFSFKMQLSGSCSGSILKSFFYAASGFFMGTHHMLWLSSSVS